MFLAKDFFGKNSRTVTVKQNEQLTFIGIPSELTHIEFYLEKNAQLHFFSLIKQKEITISVILKGEGARATINGAYLLNGSKQVNIRTYQEHRASGTTSSVLLRGVVTDSARVFHCGNVVVEKNAIHSFASQHNKTIFLSSGPYVDSSPALDVRNSASHCIHASAIGSFDKAQLFYLRSRGIAYREAQRLMLEGFFDLLCAHLSDKKVQSVAKQLLSKKVQEFL